MKRLTEKEVKDRLARRKDRLAKKGLVFEKTRVPTRKEMRNIAKAKMRKDGIPKIFKKRSDGKSFFSEIWRKWAFK